MSTPYSDRCFGQAENTVVGPGGLESLGWSRIKATSLRLSQGQPTWTLLFAFVLSDHILQVEVIPPSWAFEGWLSTIVGMCESTAQGNLRHLCCSKRNDVLLGLKWLSERKGTCPVTGPECSAPTMATCLSAVPRVQGREHMAWPWHCMNFPAHFLNVAETY